MIEVINRVNTYADEGFKSKIKDITVTSHWNCEDRVVLEVGSEVVSVLVKDLLAAIRNSSNSARF